MATIPKTGITNGQTIQASQITNIIDALDGTTSNELIVNGAITASAGIKGSITNAISSSYAVSSSYAASSLSSSHALTASYVSNAAGSNTEVQFNSLGSFGANSNFTYNSSTDTLSFGTGSLGEIQFGPYHIKQVGDNITFNNEQEDVGTTIQGFGGSTSISLGDSTLGIEGSTTNINTGASGQSVNIGTSVGTTTTIGGASSGTITIGNSGTVNLGTTAQTVNLGASTSRIELTSNQIRNASQAYFYGNGGSSAFNVGTTTSATNNQNSRAYITVSGTTSQLGLRAQTAGTNYVNFTAYDGYSAIEAVNGKNFYFNNNVNAANISFGSSTSANGKVVVYTNGATLPNQKPGASNGAYGGLFVAHNLEIGGDYAWKLSGTTWTVSSDERVKENIVTASLETCYETVKNIPLKRFNYTANYSETPLYDVNQLGWIAQEVATQFPKSIISSSFTTWTTYTGSEAVTGSNGNIVEPGDRVQDTSLGSQTIENFLSLDSDQIIKIMFGAIQHLQAKVEALESN